MLLNAMPRRIPVLARHVLLRHSLRKPRVVTNHAANYVKPPQAANANQPRKPPSANPPSENAFHSHAKEARG
jgi:hypothetical protein